MTPLNILYSDNHLLVIDKPAGIATMGSAAGTPTIARQAAEYLQRKHNKPGKAFIGVVSRLDRLVSGVLVLARTSKAASRLSEQIRQQRISKTYLALVEGRWPTLPVSCASLAPAGDSRWQELTDWVAKDESSQRMHVVDRSSDGAQLAHMRVQLLGQATTQALLRIELLTGRKHQIRLQLAQRGVPICGDSKYGARSRFSPGIALHCEQWTFSHPTLKESMTFRCSPLGHWPKIPAELRELLH